MVNHAHFKTKIHVLGTIAAKLRFLAHSGTEGICIQTAAAQPRKTGMRQQQKMLAPKDLVIGCPRMAPRLERAARY